MANKGKFYTGKSQRSPILQSIDGGKTKKMLKNNNYNDKVKIVEARCKETTLSFADKLAELIAGDIEMDPVQKNVLKITVLDAMANICWRHAKTLDELSGFNGDRN